MPINQPQIEILAIGSSVGDRILGDDATVVFDFDVQVGGWKYFGSELQNLGETTSLKPVMGIISDMGLEQRLLFPAGFAAAVNEGSDDVTDFGDVGMGGDGIAAGEDEPGKGIRILVEEAAELGKFHDQSIYPCGYIVKPETGPEIFRCGPADYSGEPGGAVSCFNPSELNSVSA